MRAHLTVEQRQLTLRLKGVALRHRVGIPWLAACRIRGERERVFWDLDAEGSRLGAAALETLLE